MALGALIAAYHEDDQGGLRALFPLAGRTLLEYQARCAAAVRAGHDFALARRVLDLPPGSIDDPREPGDFLSDEHR